MRIRALALAGAAVLALAAPTAASAAAQGFYLGLGGGFNKSDSIDAVTAPPPLIPIDIRQKTGWMAALSAGYKWDNNFRVELEGSFAQHKQQEINPPVPGLLHGTNKTKAVLANVIYDWPLGDNFTLSTGAGLGIAAVQLRSTSTALPPATPFAINDEHSGIMFQGILGLNWLVCPELELFADYHYRQVSVGNQYATDFAIGPIHLDSAVKEHAIMAGIRWYVDAAPPPPAPVPPPLPPAPPPPPEVVKTFIVFFDFDKSNLTSDAEGVVTAAVSAAKANGWVKVVVTGHTDTVGSDSYNQELSERRAGAVKDEMVRQGMSAGDITTEGKSFHDPLVPTGPGVREPQNRRAVIAY